MVDPQNSEKHAINEGRGYCGRAEETFQEEFGEAHDRSESEELGIELDRGEETFQEEFGEAHDSSESEELGRALGRAEETFQEEFGEAHDSSESEELGRALGRAKETFQEEFGEAHDSSESEEFGRILFDMSLEAEELVSRSNKAKVGRERCEYLNVEHGRVFNSNHNYRNGQEEETVLERKVTILRKNDTGSDKQNRLRMKCESVETQTR